MGPTWDIDVRELEKMVFLGFLLEEKPTQRTVRGPSMVEHEAEQEWSPLFSSGGEGRRLM